MKHAIQVIVFLSKESAKNMQLIVIFQNKDVFMIYHKAHLTRRLILGTSADSEKEENMVEWLREVGMPADFINKLSRMFQDMKVSEDLNGQFKNHLGKVVSAQTANLLCNKLS